MEKFKVGDIIRHKQAHDLSIIFAVRGTPLKCFFTFLTTGKDQMEVGSHDSEAYDTIHEDYELAEEGVVDRILTKYNNGEV